MRFVIFCHSLLSDWNHGNAHFLRGVTGELLRRGHQVRVYEPRDAWSVLNLQEEEGKAALRGAREAYPWLSSVRYQPRKLDLDRALRGADVVLVHEWNERDIVRRIGRHRKRRGGYRLFFHDTHHRSVSEPGEMRRYDLSGYDGVLTFGRIIANAYRRHGWSRRTWVWHEAADTAVFRPRVARARGDLVWIGNWGDGERSAELDEFLIRPVRELGLNAAVYGVRYSRTALRALARAGIEYRGWLPNYRVPEIFARYRATLHVPRRPYVRALKGIPTIRVFEALACGIPLLSAPWDDCEGLFSPGRDFLLARDGREMRSQLDSVLRSRTLARGLARRGRNSVLQRHTCAHRVDELLRIVEELDGERSQAA